MHCLSKIISCFVLICTFAFVSSENVNLCDNFDKDVFYKRHWDCINRITSTYYPCEFSNAELFEEAAYHACCQSESVCQQFTDGDVEDDVCKEDVIINMEELADDGKTYEGEICKFED